MPLPDLLDALCPQAHRTGRYPLPPGVAYVRSLGKVEIWVHQTPPQLWNLKWIRRAPPKPGETESKARRNTYRDVAIALPYIITVAAFSPRELSRGRTVSDSNECFFRNEPLQDSRTDELFVPALLNCSLFKMPDGKSPIGLDGRPAVWICTQYLDRSRFDGEEDEERRMLLGFQTLMTMLLGAGFNYSSEMHELTSGFSVSRDVDPRVSTIEAWVKASAQDPGFATSVPWLKAGYTVDEIVDRMFRRHNAFRVNARNAEDISHVVCRQHARQRLGDDKAHLLAALLGLEES